MTGGAAPHHGGQAGPTPAGLEIVPVTFRRAKAFIAAHHRHHKPPQGMVFCLGIAAGDELVGVATVGRPVARAYQDARGTASFDVPFVSAQAGGSAVVRAGPGRPAVSAPLPEGRDAVTRAVMILAFGGADADHLLAARGVVSAQASAQVVVVDDEGETTIAVASEFWAAALGGPVRHVGAGS